MPDSMRERLDAEAEADREAMEAQMAPDEPDPAPEPEPAPAPEQPAEAEATTEPAESTKPRDDGMVPLAALKEERTRRQELERQQREMAQQMAELRGRFEGMMQQPKAAAPQPEPEKPDPEPKYDDNPAEWFRWRDRQQSKEIAALKKAAESYENDRKQRQQQEQADQQRQQFLGHYANAAQTFARETQDFGEAYQFLVKSRVDELVALGYSPQQASQYQQQEEANVAAHALSQGANPAERLYAIAKMRGYAKADAPAPAQPPAPTPAPSAAAAPNPLRAQLSKSLSAAPGAPSNPPTLEQIASMSDAEYGRVVDSPEAFRRLMGG